MLSTATVSTFINILRRATRSGWLVAALLTAGLMGVLATLGADALTRTGETEVRINAFLHTNGDVVFAIQQRQPDARWSERLEPSANRLPADHSGRWAVSTPVRVNWQFESEKEDEWVIAVVSQIETIEGIQVEVDRFMEVETFPTAQPLQTRTLPDGTMESGGPVGDYEAFCNQPHNIQPGSGIDPEPSRTLYRALRKSRDRQLSTTEWLGLLDLELNVWTSVTPPPAFALFHNAMIAGLQSVRAAYAGRDPDAIAYEARPNPHFFLDKKRRTAWSSGFPADTIYRLKVGSCIEAPELEGGFMGG
ncbi:MAG: hypothetical protein OXS30_00390 [Chloroflexota bacterium]|nr:hypothetical protein [Chloroflexota bacterium]